MRHFIPKQNERIAIKGDGHGTKTLEGTVLHTSKMGCGAGVLRVWLKEYPGEILAEFDQIVFLGEK